MDNSLLLFIFTTAVFDQTWCQYNYSNSNNSTATPQSLVCMNNGIIQNGICICPDDWIGTTCNIPYFCPETTLTTLKLSFPKTVLGQFASSVERCPPESTNAGMHKASALCNIATHLFDSANILNCSLTLDAINAWVSAATPEQKQTLASSTQILTSIAERLTPNNITHAARIAVTLLTDTQTALTTDIAVSAVATVSQLLSASHEKYSSVDHNEISQLTRTLLDLSLRKMSNSLLVQPNMAVQSLKEPTTPIKQVQLTSFKGQSDTFLPDRIKLYTTEPEISKNVVDLQMNVTFNKEFDKVVGFVLYDNDQFFKSKSFQPSLDTKRRVISANLQESSGTDQFLFTVTPSADPTLSVNDFACVFWSYEKQDWITDGCTKTENPSGHLVCKCERKNNANFAILMAYDINYQYSEALHWLSITGSAMSVVGLCVTALYQTITRKSRGFSPTLLVVNICISMMVFYLLFIFGINNPVQHVNVAKVSGQNIIPESDYHKYQDEGPCTAFTALLQYFLLATFTWNTLYGLNVFLLFKNSSVSGTPSWFPKVSMAVGWGLPAVIVGISLGSTYRVDEPLGYRQEEFCWLASMDYKQKFSIKKPMLWGFVLPLMLMLISSTAILLHFSYNICRTNPNLNRSRKTPLKKKILSSFSLAVMLGLSWVIGYILLITQEKTLRLILSVVFCLLNTTQGIQIFIFFTLRPFLNSNPAILNSLHGPEIGLHKKSFYLWKNKMPEGKESYKSTDDLA